MIYWPGTNIIKSQHNDFNWRKKTDFADMFRKSTQHSLSGRMGAIGRVKQALERGEAFYLPSTNAYSKARSNT